MQIHGPSVTFDEIAVRLNPGGFAVIELGDSVSVFAYTPGECRKLRAAVDRAEALLLGQHDAGTDAS